MRLLYLKGTDFFFLLSNVHLMTLLTEVGMPRNNDCERTTTRYNSRFQEYFYIKSKKLNFLMTWFWSNQLRLFCWDSLFCCCFFAFILCRYLSATNHNDLKESKICLRESKREKSGSILFDKQQMKISHIAASSRINIYIITRWLRHER